MKKQKTIAERAWDIANGERFQAAKARAILEELAEAKDAFEESSIDSALTAMEEALTALEPANECGALPMSLELARELFYQLRQALPDPEQMQDLVSACEELDSRLDDLASATEPGSGYSKDEKDTARDAARDAMVTLTDALDTWYTFSSTPDPDPETSEMIDA